MSELLHKSAVDYLLLRSLRGYQPCDQEWLIREYLDFLDLQGFTTITVSNGFETEQRGQVKKELEKDEKRQRPAGKRRPGKEPRVRRSHTGFQGRTHKGTLPDTFRAGRG